MIAASASIEGCGGVDAVVAAVDGAERAVDGSEGDGDITSEEASSVTSALALASIVRATVACVAAPASVSSARASCASATRRAGKTTMENGALDIHDAAAWDDSALVAAYDAAIEKYEELHPEKKKKAGVRGSEASWSRSEPSEAIESTAARSAAMPDTA